MMNKKFLFSCLTIFFALILINILSFITIKIVTNKNIYTIEYKNFKKRFRKSEFKTMYPHPYFGFGVNQNFNSQSHINDEPLFVNDIDQNKLDNKTKILILGGSVAKHLSSNNASDKFMYKNIEINNNDIFQKTLNEYFLTKDFFVLNAAIDGGKQPQQLFKLYYLDLNKFEFDIIINLDGFNELALSLSENYAINDHLIYPRNYSRLVSTFNSDFDCVKDLNVKVNRFSIIPLIEIYDLYKIRKCHFKLEGQNKNSGTRFSEITNYKKKDFQKSVQISKNIWINSSNKIDEFSNNNEILYIHVIQPNLYLKGSKILTPSETKLLNYPKYGDVISDHYKKFDIEYLNAEKKLDLKYIFKNNSKELYRDYCCHLNNLGMHLLSLEIINSFKSDFENFIN